MISVSNSWRTETNLNFARVAPYCLVNDEGISLLEEVLQTDNINSSD